MRPSTDAAESIDMALPWRVMPSKHIDGSTGVYLLDAHGQDVCDFYTYRKDEHGIDRGIIPFDNAEARAAYVRDCAQAMQGVANPAMAMRELLHCLKCARLHVANSLEIAIAKQVSDSAKDAFRELLRDIDASLVRFGGEP